MNVGRNQSCPCGSGKKFKRCCLNGPDPKGLDPRSLREIGNRLRENRDQEARRLAEFGAVRPIVSIEAFGMRFVAVRGRLSYSANWKTFPDFLMSFMGFIFPQEWAAPQFACPLEERHQVMQWYDHLCRFQAKQSKLSDGLYSAIPDGLAAAYWLLAYDLYIVENNVSIPARLLERLRSARDFQAARYEVFVAATMVRADFDLQFEDEDDPSQTHPEFRATHRPSGLAVAVEAKSRHRSGVLGFPGERESYADLRSGVWGVIKKALEKQLKDPLFLFVDVNLPPGFGGMADQKWVSEIETEFARTFSKHAGDTYLASAYFTNTPHHYGEADAPDPEKRNYVMRNPAGRFGKAEVQAVDWTIRALLQYGNVPNWFDNEHADDT